MFAPDYAPEEITEIARKLRRDAGLPATPSGEVAYGKRRSSARRPASSRRAAAARR